MKKVELYRHSIKLGHGDCDLSPEGIEKAMAMGRELLRGKGYTHLYVSPLIRTTETINAFALGAGDFPDVTLQEFPPHVTVSTSQEAMRLWTGVCHRAEAHGTDMLQAVLEQEAEVGQVVAAEAAKAFVLWLKDLPEEAHALVVGHSPFLELMIYGLFNKQLTQFQPCDGACITFNDGVLSLE